MRQDGYLVILCAILLLLETAPKSSLRVFGIRDERFGYPNVVRLETHTKIYIQPNRTIEEIKYFCTATALTSTWTLTAEHCLLTKKKYLENNTRTTHVRILIRYGHPHLNSRDYDQVCAVLKAISPRKLNHLMPNDDIALLYTEPILVEIYDKISAIDYVSLRGQEVTMMGFGRRRGNPTASEFENTTTLDKPSQIIDRGMVTSCDVRYVHKTAICAVPLCRELQWLLHEDSGGPVLHGSGIIGVISAISDPHSLQATEGMRGIIKPNIAMITPVSPYMDWIHSHVSGGEKGN